MESRSQQISLASGLEMRSSRLWGGPSIPWLAFSEQEKGTLRDVVRRDHGNIKMELVGCGHMPRNNTKACWQPPKIRTRQRSLPSIFRVSTWFLTQNGLWSLEGCPMACGTCVTIPGHSGNGVVRPPQWFPTCGKHSLVWLSGPCILCPQPAYPGSLSCPNPAAKYDDIVSVHTLPSSQPSGPAAPSHSTDTEMKANDSPGPCSWHPFLTPPSSAQLSAAGDHLGGWCS